MAKDAITVCVTLAAACAAMLLGAASARAEADQPGEGAGAVITSPGLVLTGAPVALSLGSARSDSPHVAFGRDQDIVGMPVDVRAARARGVAAIRGLTRLPGVAVMPGRLPLVSAALTSTFGLRRHPIYGDLRAHRGVDLAAPMGTPVYASAAGYVESAGWSGGYGIMVAIEHPGGMETRYGHLSRTAVSPGQAVAAGSLIGYVGSTGDSTGPHLHYEVRINGQAVDPLRR
ncbi:MAG: M23 family metallopeptidase [Novosphingobium sp.]